MRTVRARLYPVIIPAYANQATMVQVSSIRVNVSLLYLVAQPELGYSFLDFSLPEWNVLANVESVQTVPGCESHHFEYTGNESFVLRLQIGFQSQRT